MVERQPSTHPSDAAIVGAIGAVRLPGPDLSEEGSPRELDRLRRLVGDLPSMIWEAVGRPEQDQQRLVFVNAFAERLFGHPTTVWLNTPNFWFQVIDPEDRDRVQAAMGRVLDGRQEREMIDCRCKSRDGQVVWVESILTSVREPGDDARRLRGMTLDISERKRTEHVLSHRAHELARMARQLQQSNEELDQFAYITSHDLRAPLRGIAHLSGWIEEDMGDRMTDTARAQMETLRGRVNRMEALINGLLQYSRVGKVFTEVERIDVNELLAEVVDLLAAPPTFRIEIAPRMPVIRGERLRLQQVFLNLIGNAIQHHDRFDGKVSITCAEAGDSYRFCVTDDGPGIASRFHSKIFVIFQTLLPRDHREATGVGLSLVKKIVEEQGGTVEVHSEEGKGACFCFTWARDRDRTK